jgi:hypothetical protein
MKRIILSLMVVLFSSSVAAEWTLVRNDGEQDVEIFVNKESIKKDGNLVTIWTLIDYKSPRSVGGKKQLSTKSLDEYDCQNEQYRTLNLYWYSDNKGEGKIVYSELVPGRMQPIIPNSVFERVWKITCGKK